MESQLFWRERYKVASSALLSLAALLAVLDFVARDSAERGASILYLSLALLLGAVWAFFTDWDSLPEQMRLAPAVAVLIVMLASIYWAQSADTSHAVIGFAATAVLILTYVGLVMPPGSPLLFSPLVIIVVLLANRQEAFRVSLAVPLIGVPVAALVGELISALVDRSMRTARWFASRTERLARLDDVLRRFRRPATLNQAAQEVAHAAREIFEAERSTVVLRDVNGGLIPVTVGPFSGETPDAETAVLVAEAIGGDEPRLVPSGKNTMLVLPLPAADVPAGAVVVHPVPNEDPAYTIDLARLFGTQVGIAIEHLFVINELERATTRDELTGIGNRKHADALLNSLDEGDALILLDLDGFKAVNDTHGHSAGDQVLLDLGHHLKQCLRDSDTSARLGGDEFLVVARRAFADPGAVAERILRGWADAGRPTTLSAGVALHANDVNVADTFDRADQALYRAKELGKNQVHLWQVERPDELEIDLTDEPEGGVS